MPNSRIIGTGMSVPEHVVTNALLAQCMDTSDEWIRERTGIRERRVSLDTFVVLNKLSQQTDKGAFLEEVARHGLLGGIDSTMKVSDLAFDASRMALDRAGKRVDGIDLMIVSATISDFAIPHAGNILHGKLSPSKTIPVFCLQQGCAGFSYGLHIADLFIKTGECSCALVVGAELLSPILKFTDQGRDTAVLFGDGAGAAVLEAAEGISSCVLATHLHSDGTRVKDLYAEICGSSTFPFVSEQKQQEGRDRIIMDGKKVFAYATRGLKGVTLECVRSSGVSIQDIDLFVFHQANLRILERVAGDLRIPMDKIFVNIERYGNTAGASVPIGLHEACERGRIKRGDLVLMASFGTGFSWGASLIRY